MKWPAISIPRLLREAGVRDVAQPIVSGYLARELPLETAARRLATIVRATLQWKAQHVRPRIVYLSPDQLIHSRLLLPEGSSDFRAFSSRVSSLSPAPSTTPSVRNPNPDEVYDDAVRLNACYDVLREVRERWAQVQSLYDAVGRLLEAGREDAA